MGHLTFHDVEESAKKTLHDVEASAGRALHGAEAALLGFTRPPEPRWPVIVASFAVAGLHYTLPATLGLPRWFSWGLPLLIALLMIPTVLTLRLGRRELNQFFGFAILVVLTAAELWSLFLLIGWLLNKQVVTPKSPAPPFTTQKSSVQTAPAAEKPSATANVGTKDDLKGMQLLEAAAALWGTNIIVFALWYWRIDAGGPNMRDLRSSHTHGAFLFPQMTLDADQKEAAGVTFWSPTFVDYLFIAFTQSTSFAPADTGVLSRWAKILVMVQATVSLITIATVAGRAINIL